MNKLLIGILLCCFSCGIKKKQEVVQSLSHTAIGDQVYILTVFPNSFKDTTNATLSLLILSSNEQNKQSLLAYCTLLKPNTTRANIFGFYADSVEKLNQTRFPILFGTALNDSLGEEVRWSIRKQKLEFHGKNSKNEVDWELKHSEKDAYIELKKTNDTVVRVFEPILTLLNDESTNAENQEYVAFLSIVRNAGFLFDRTKNSYYWFDTRTEDGQHFSLFVARDDANNIDVLYNTFPYEGKPILNENEIYWENAKKMKQASIHFSEETGKLRFFRIENTQLVNNELLIGKGVMYQL